MSEVKYNLYITYSPSVCRNTANFLAIIHNPSIAN